MSMRATTALVLAVFAAGAARAQESELDRIPQSVPTQQATPTPASANQIFYLQDDLIGATRRDNLLVGFPPPLPARREERLFADDRSQWSLADGLKFVLSGRLNLRAEDGLDFPNHEDVRLDLREAYLVWQLDGETFLDLGRINVKSGVALGFNPTDFFKTRAVVEPLSADPSVLREDRLGTLMLYGQHVWEHAALSLAIAPKVADRSALYTNDDLPSFNPVFDRTNAGTRMLAKGNVELFDDFNPEFLAFSDAGHWSYGTNLTRGFGQQIVGYVEWAGGDRPEVADDALHYGKATGTIPDFAPSFLPVGPTRPFQNDVAAGLSYTTETRITFNLEYHYHQAGFSDADWQSWFKAGGLHVAPVEAELWYIRDFALDQQEPINRQQVFLRADWQDAFVRDLELTAFVNMDVRDYSSFAQATADYYLSREWTVGALVSGTLGGKRTNFGSLPSSATLLLHVSRYF